MDEANTFNETNNEGLDITILDPGLNNEEEQIIVNERQDSEEDQQQVEETTENNQYNEIYSEQMDLTNHLLSGQIFFMGLIFGVILFKVFWDRWKI